MMSDTRGRSATTMFLAVIAIMLSIVTAVLSPIPAYADLVNVVDFSNVPREDRYRLNRHVFIANSYDGQIIQQLRPGENETTAKLGTDYPDMYDYYDYIKEGDPLPITMNGESIFLSEYTVVDGVYWGSTQPNHNNSLCSWIRMDQVLVAYTSNDFVEANKDSIREIESSDTSEEATKKWEEEALIEPDVGTVFWQWPGSDREKVILEDTSYFQCSISMKYTDDHGNEWGMVHVNQRVYILSGWVCLDDPKNADITAFNPEPTPQRWAPEATYDWSIGQVDYPDPINPLIRTVNRASDDPFLVAMMVVGAILTSVIVVVVIFWLTKRRGQKALESSDALEHYDAKPCSLPGQNDKEPKS